MVILNRCSAVDDASVSVGKVLNSVQVWILILSQFSPTINCEVAPTF